MVSEFLRLSSGSLTREKRPSVYIQKQIAYARIQCPGDSAMQVIGLKMTTDRQLI